MFGRSLYIIVALVVASISLFFSRKSSAPNLDQPRRFPGRNNTVLFLTDSHAGNSNVHVAASHALLLEFPDLEIHFASFPKLEKAITATSKFAVQQKPSTAPIIFHPLEGKTFTEAVGYSIEDAIQRPGLGGIERLCSNMQRFLMPWTASDYVALYEHIMGVLDEVDPIVVITDSLLSPALDATRAQGRNHVTLSPNSLKDNFASMQPWGSMFWKYPAYTSRTSFAPVPKLIILQHLFRPSVSRSMAPYSSKHLPQHPFYLQCPPHPIANRKENIPQTKWDCQTIGCILDLPKGLPLADPISTRTRVSHFLRA
jgi:hypothetical protein